MAQNANTFLTDQALKFYLTGLGRAFANNYTKKAMAHGHLKAV
jgi:hypothetical protein